VRTEHQNKVLLDYIWQLKSELWLVDWTLVLSEESPSSEDTIAMVEPIIGRKRATIYLCSDFCDMSAKKQTHSLVHELIHLHHIPATDIIRLDVAKDLSQSTYDLLWGVFKRQMEYCVDGLADAFSRLVKEIDYTERSIESSETANDNQA